MGPDIAGYPVWNLHSKTPHPKVALNPKDPVTWGKVPRNSACPCGSGKKYKHCHGSPNYAPTATA